MRQSVFFSHLHSPCLEHIYGVFFPPTSTHPVWSIFEAECQLFSDFGLRFLCVLLDALCKTDKMGYSKQLKH